MCSTSGFDQQSFPWQVLCFLFFKAKWILLHLIIILGTANVLAVFCSLEWIHGMFPPGLRFWWVAYRGKGNFIRCISSLRPWNPFKLNTRNLAESSFWVGWNGGREVRVPFVNGGDVVETCSGLMNWFQGRNGPAFEWHFHPRNEPQIFRKLRLEGATN